MQASEWKFTYIYNERSRSSPKAMLFPRAGPLLLCATKKRIENKTLQVATTIKGKIANKQKKKTLLYSTVFFTLNPLLQFYRQLFLSLLFVARKVSKRAQRRTKSVVTTFAHEFSLDENVPRSVAPCRQLTLDSRGSVKFGHAYCASENIPTLFRASLQPLPVILTALYFLKVTVAIINSNGNIKD